MRIAACFLALSACVCSATPADEPQSPAAQPPAAQPPAAQTSAAQTPAQTTVAQTTAASAAAGAGDAKPAPGAPAGPAPKADKSEVVNVAATEAEIKQMRSRGYKPLNRNGMLVFCRDEGELGTHFQRTRCSTLKQLKDAELSGKEYARSIQQQGSAVPFKGP